MNLLEDAIKEIVSKAETIEWKLYRNEHHPFLAILNEADKQQSAWGKVISDIAIQQLTGEQDE